MSPAVRSFPSVRDEHAIYKKAGKKESVLGLSAIEVGRGHQFILGVNYNAPDFRIGRQLARVADLEGHLRHPSHFSIDHFEGVVVKSRTINRDRKVWPRVRRYLPVSFQGVPDDGEERQRQCAAV